MATRTKKTATAGEMEVEETATPKKAAKKPAARKKTAAKKKTAKKKTAAKKASARRKGGDGALATVEASAEDGEATESPRRGKGPHYLVVVESPAKAKTIKKYLGSGYTVKASVGHILDLPKSKMGVDLEHDFEPQYEVIKGKEKVLSELKKAAQGVDKVFLATDPDREGEAIAWHINQQLGHQNAYRVMFNEITKSAIQEAIAQPRQLSQENYDSQQTRRILDRLVGYQISPILWKKVRRGLSAGRVQSVAVRLVCEREDGIKAFVPQEYWTLDAIVEGPSGPPPFKAKLAKVDGKKADLKDKDTTHGLLEEIKSAAFTVTKVDKRERRRNAPAPFITSKLQQEAANRLHYTAKKTMALAQRLYEGVPLGEEGPTALITYMRTDSTRLSDQAVVAVRDFIGQTYGADYLPEAPVVYRTKKGAQDAHEAIRPTSLDYPPSKVKAHFDAMNDDMAADMFRLYELIWNRFVACQTKPAVYDQTSAEISAGRALFRASGSTLKFPGYLAIYGATLTPEEEAAQEKARAAGEDTDEDGVGELPVLNDGDKLSLQKLLDEQHFTQPPPRFSEATLVKELEERGIGRPSTYAAILSTIQDKKYVEKLEGRFRPTDLGVICNELLVKHFPHELDVAFTASMEEKLDQISEGEANWKAVLKDFYAPFKETLEKAEVEMRDVKREEVKTDVACEKCGNIMVIKWGKMGHFLACSNYPECKNTKDFKRDADGKIVIIEEETTDEKCENCAKPMVVKRGRFGKFLACSGYPECKTSKPISIGVTCPDCKQGYLTERRSRFGKIFFGCNRYPDCKFAAWDRPLPEACPQCQSPYLVQKYSKRDGPFIACPNKECDYRRQIVEPEVAAAAAATAAPAPTAGGPNASSAA